MTSNPTETAPRPLLAFVRLGRPKFLFQSMLVVAAGVTIAVHSGHQASLGWYLVTLLFAWCTHLMTHYCNEYFDLEADRANAAPTSWTGGSRILVGGHLRPEVSLGAAFVLLFVGVLLLALLPSLETRLVATTIIALAWLYTAPPLRLNYHGLGEASCALVLYGLGPLLACVVQAGTIDTAGLGYVGVLFVFQFLRMAIMNLSDIEGDRATGKRTLAVLLGAAGLVRLFAVGQFVGYAAIALLLVTGVIPVSAGLLMLATAPVPIWVTRQLTTGALAEPRRANAVTFWASMHMPLTSSSIIVGLLVDLGVHGGRLWQPWLAVVGATFLIFGTWLVRAAQTNRASAPSPAE
ncbi:prenyltransferase [Saccharopolyspora sp. NPDC050389]|uniref:prenyltransferase n=1 Tax=Saccharopolyspora sp. NPDC050389 TaxID=3155516 RepID=UPI0033F836AB